MRSQWFAGAFIMKIITGTCVMEPEDLLSGKQLSQCAGLTSSCAPHFLSLRFLKDDSLAQQAFYELFSHPGRHEYSTFMGLLRSGLVKRSHSMPAIAMPTQSQVKKLKRLMTEKMSWEMAYIMDSRHLMKRRRGEHRQSLLSVQNVLDSRFQRVWKF